MIACEPRQRRARPPQLPDAACELALSEPGRLGHLAIAAPLAHELEDERVEVAHAALLHGSARAQSVEPSMVSGGSTSLGEGEEQGFGGGTAATDMPEAKAALSRTSQLA
jgi:hypothetical protein